VWTPACAGATTKRGGGGLPRSANPSADGHEEHGVTALIPARRPRLVQDSLRPAIAIDKTTENGILLKEFNSSIQEGGPMRVSGPFTNRAVLSGAALAVCLAFAPVVSGRPAHPQTTSKDVYVCACMKTSSCPCKSMANKAGKCPCGDEMRAVPRDSEWAKNNRKALD
jgi:hypothetical protein